MTQKNDSGRDDLEQIKKRAEENLIGLGEMLESNSEFADDIVALQQHSLMFIEDVDAIAEKMRKDTETLNGDIKPSLTG